MLVKQIMIHDVVTVSPGDTLWQADKLMLEGRFRHLPVVEEGRLVGIVSDRDIRTPVFLRLTTDAVQVMRRRRIGEIMHQPVTTVSQMMAVEQAAAILYENKVGCLPVVEGEEKLVGILTESDIFRVFVQVMGVLIPSSRLELRLPDGPGPLAKVTDILREHDMNVVSLVTEPAANPAERNVVLRLQTIDPWPIIRAFTQAGLEVVSPRPGCQPPQAPA